MDHKAKVTAIANWIAMKDPDPAQVASVLANAAGLIARSTAEDECERHHAGEALQGYLDSGLNHELDVLRRG